MTQFSKHHYSMERSRLLRLLLTWWSNLLYSAKTLLEHSSISWTCGSLPAPMHRGPHSLCTEVSCHQPDERGTGFKLCLLFSHWTFKHLCAANPSIWSLLEAKCSCLNVWVSRTGGPEASLNFSLQGQKKKRLRTHPWSCSFLLQ